MYCDYCGEELTTSSQIVYYTGGTRDVHRDTIPMLFKCRRCGGSFCSKHRLPERHECPGLAYEKNITLDPTLYKNNVSNIENPEPVCISMKDGSSDTLYTGKNYEKNFFCKIGLHNWSAKFYDGMVKNKNGSSIKVYSKICKNCTKKVTQKKRNLMSILLKAIILFLALVLSYSIFRPV